MKTNHFRILVVDDDRPILDLFEKILCPTRGIDGPSSLTSSFDLTLCKQAREAVDAVSMAIEKGHPFAGAFLDIHLPPGPDGVWAAEHIRKMDPDINMVLITGYSHLNMQEIGARIPPADKLLYLRKPFDVHEIWQCAFSLSSKWETEKDLRTFQTELESKVEKRTSELLEANRRLKSEVEKSARGVMALRANEEKFRGIINNNADGIIILDQKGIVHFMNPAAEALFNRKAGKSIGENFGFPVLSGQSTELDIISGAGDPIAVEMRAATTEWDGEPAFLASLRDITEHKRMQQQIQESLEDLKNTMKGTVRAIAATVEKRDLYTAGHQERVASLSDAIAREMGLSSEQREGLILAAVIHDIGKITVPAEILSKTGRLNELEFKMIQTHPEVAYEILKPIEFPWPIARIVLQHHERMDGSGYPHGISGEEILMEARVLGVADVVEAMASHRPYRPALGIDKGLDEISKNKGIHYDADVVDACLKLFTEKDFEWG